MNQDFPAEIDDPDQPTRLEPGGPNALAITLGIVGDEWNLQILRFALQGATRYADFREHLPISHTVLSGRLAWLKQVGIFRRVVYQERPERSEYLLTKRGRETWQLLIAVWMWEARWVDHHDDRLPTMRHHGCADDVTLELHCNACLVPVEARDIEGAFGPSGSWERSVPAGRTRRRSIDADVLRFPETMALLGNRWSSAIIGVMFQGVGRFKDFESVLQAPPTVISDRLKRLTELKIVRATPSAQRADWFDYRLTEKGLAFYSVVAFAFDWGQRWFLAPEGDAFVTTHRECGEPFVPCFVCTTCGERAEANRLAVVTVPQDPSAALQPDGVAGTPPEAPQPKKPARKQPARKKQARKKQASTKQPAKKQAPAVETAEDQTARDSSAADSDTSAAATDAEPRRATKQRGTKKLAAKPLAAKRSKPRSGS